MQQDAAIWELSDMEVDTIFSNAIVDSLSTGSISEDDLIEHWVNNFRKYMPSFEAEIVPYKGIDTYSEYTWTWAKENPNSWVH